MVKVDKDFQENARIRVKSLFNRYIEETARTALDKPHPMVEQIIRFGVSSKELAEILGVTPAAISQYLKGQTKPSLDIEYGLFFILLELVRNICSFTDKYTAEIDASSPNLFEDYSSFSKSVVQSKKRGNLTSLYEEKFYVSVIGDLIKDMRDSVVVLKQFAKRENMESALSYLNSFKLENVDVVDFMQKYEDD